MKYKTFRVFAYAGLVVMFIGGGVGSCLLCMGCPNKETKDAPSATATPPPPPATARANTNANASANTNANASATASASANGDALRPMDKEILDRLAQNITGDKVKDAFPGRPYKVSLFKDAGQAKVNRVKIDLNRNEKWDEKWSIEEEGGKEKIKRQVAPNDDENYTVEYRLQAGAWVAKKK